VHRGIVRERETVQPASFRTGKQKEAGRKWDIGFKLFVMCILEEFRLTFVPIWNRIAGSREEDQDPSMSYDPSPYQ
jgi:hypothetical protein